MTENGTISIRDRQWYVSVASAPWELAQGLGGIPEIPAGAGMLFDVGGAQIIQVTTVPMLFPLDIAFISETLVVTEVYRNIQPDYLVTSTLPVRFFLEVNAGELEEIDAGDRASVEVILLSGMAPDWTSAMVSFMGFMMMGVFMVGMVKAFTKKLLEAPKKKPVLYGPRGEQLLPQTRAKSRFIIQMDRIGSIVITRHDQPGKSVYLQFQSDKEAVYEILRKSEREELDKGWNVEIRDSEPRASILQELWENSALLSLTEWKWKAGAHLSTSPRTKAGKPTRDEISVESWVERDRIGIWITDKRTDKTIAEWWDEDAAQMFEDGFFKPGRIEAQTITGREFENSVLDYAEYIGITEKSREKTNYLPQTTLRGDVIEIPFKDAPQWVQDEWKSLHPGSIPRVHVYRTNTARIDSPVFEYAVRDIVASKAGRTMSRYVPAYESLLAATPEEKALYFGGAVRLKPDEAIAVMDFWSDRFKSIDLYVHPEAYEPAKVIAPSLSGRQKKILATIRAFTSKYRKEVFDTNRVTQSELDELQSMGLIDRRRALTVMGRNVVGREEPLSSYLPQTKALANGRTVWIRYGDISEYFDFNSPYDAGKGVGMVLSERPFDKKPLSYHYMKSGVEIQPYFTGHNYVSLFWGDENAQWVRDLSEIEKKEFEQGINETLRRGHVLEQGEYLPQTEGRYVKVITSGKTSLTMGSVISLEEFKRENKRAKERGEQPATGMAWEEGKPVWLRPDAIPASSESLPVARLLEKWRTAKTRNSALALKDLEALGSEYDISECKQALMDYRDIEPSDYAEREDYQEARDEAWDEFIECLESLAGEEEEMFEQPPPPRVKEDVAWVKCKSCGERWPVKRSEVSDSWECPWCKAKSQMSIESKRTNRRSGLSTGKPSVTPMEPQRHKGSDELEYFADSPEFLTQTIDAIGYRDRIDNAFLEAIARARQRR